MIRFQATASHLGEHRGKQECIGGAHKRDRDRGIVTEFLFEAFGSLHSAESSTENQHMLRLLNRRGEFLLGAENPGNQGVAALDQHRDGCAIHDPTDQGGQMCTHLSRSPFGHRSGEQGDSDHADEAPQGNSEQRWQSLAIQYSWPNVSATRSRYSGDAMTKPVPTARTNG